MVYKTFTFVFCNSDTVQEFATDFEKLNCILRQCGDNFGRRRKSFVCSHQSLRIRTRLLPGTSHVLHNRVHLKCPRTIWMLSKCNSRLSCWIKFWRTTTIESLEIFSGTWIPSVKYSHWQRRKCNLFPSIFFLRLIFHQYFSQADPIHLFGRWWASRQFI